jgi:glycosyltransferase involved in cell wall biosynthesis
MAIVTGRVCNVPVIVTVHGSDLLVIPKRSRLMRRLVKYVLNGADAVTSVAEHLTSEILRMGVPPQRVLTFPMSVPTESFSSEGPVPKGWPTAPVIFSNRSLYPIYNIDLLVEAAPAILKKIPEARILIAGEGPEKEKIVRRAQDLGVTERVELLGTIPHQQMPNYLRGASVYVSTALSDGASVSLLEAMACGTLPVVADIPANREWIQEGKNGALFAPGDADALAAKVLQCIGDTTMRTTAREINASLIHQRAQWNSNVEKLLELYERVIAQRGIQKPGRA